MTNITRNAHTFYYPRLDVENLANLPGVLKRCCTWVAWKEAQPDEPGAKWKKIPVNPRTGRNARSNQPSTGATFDEALAYFLDHPEMRGIGLILTAENEFCGIDADHCVDLETKAIDAPTADLIRLVDSYTEITSSGDGIHIVVMAKLGSGCKFPFNGRTYEIYDHDRFFVFTGKHVANTSVSCWDRQKTIDSLMPSSSRATAPRSIRKPRTEDPVAADVDAIGDQEIIRLIEESGQAEKFKALMAGETTGYTGYFAATGALCAILAAWTRCNAERIDRIARGSGLIAGWEKWWDERYGDGRTRGERTIDAACAIAAAGWMYSPRTNFIVNDNGSVKPILANAITMLKSAPEWNGVLAYNEFSLFTVALKPPPWPKPVGSNWADVDDLRVADWLQHKGILVTPQTAREAVQAVADENRFHPVREYLDRLKWDGVERLDKWLTEYLGVVSTEFSLAVGSRFLISGVARIYRPGCRADHTLILEGPQGGKKSTALSTLAVRPEWFTDHVGDLETKDALLGLHGVWIIEFAELASIRRSQVSRVKSFLTSPSDYFRPPYGHRHEHVPRTNVFCGSVNEETYLADETGNRRFWPVRCGNINAEKLRADRDQLWAEAVERYKDGDEWWLGTSELDELAAKETDQRYESGVWDEIIISWLENPRKRTEFGTFSSDHDSVTIGDVLFHAIGKDIDKLTQADRNQVARCLKHEGWKPDRKYVDDAGKEVLTKADSTKRIAVFRRPQPATRQPGDE